MLHTLLCLTPQLIVSGDQTKPSNSPTPLPGEPEPIFCDAEVRGQTCSLLQRVFILSLCFLVSLIYGDFSVATTLMTTPCLLSLRLQVFLSEREPDETAEGGYLKFVISMGDFGCEPDEIKKLNKIDFLVR